MKFCEINRTEQNKYTGNRRILDGDDIYGQAKP
jgi:hypothetical protein